MSEIIDNFEVCEVIHKKFKKIINKIYVFDDKKGLNVLFVTLYDKVFGFGSNDFGVCGFGHQMVVNEPNIIEELCDKSVILFQNGYGFAFALTSDNKLYGWGRNDCGQLGLNVINPQKIYKPVLIDDFNNIVIKQISCGFNHTLLLSSDGYVYGWGDNTYGQIGCGNEFVKNISVITQLESLPTIKSIHCSFHQSFALTLECNGMVYSWGYNNWCQLGYEFKQDECIFAPILIDNLSYITSICSSNTNTYFLSNSGNIYFCGLYHDENNKESFQVNPNIIKFPKLITFLNIFKSSKSYHTVHSKIIHRDEHSIASYLQGDQIFELIHNRTMKLKFKSVREFYSENYQMTPETICIKIETIEKESFENIIGKYIQNEITISNLILKNFTICKNPNLNNFTIKYFHIFDDNNGFNILFVSKEDKVYSFGSNQFGSCGLGHNKNVKDPQIIPELCYKNIEQFSNGLDFVLGIDNDNKLYGWGRNNYGQLGKSMINGVFNKPALIGGLNNISMKQIFCGSFHTLMLTSDRLVCGWGDNRHGQIGCGKESGEYISITTHIDSLLNIKSIHCSFNKSFALTDNGMVFSWGQNDSCDLGQELDRYECIFEPKLIENLENIKSICCSKNSTYFLTMNGEFYFCGKYFNEINVKCYQTIPVFLTNSLVIHTLYSMNTYQRSEAIGCALTDECVYYLHNKTIEKTHYKTFEEFYSNECQLTHKIFYLDLLMKLHEDKIKIQGNF